MAPVNVLWVIDHICYDGYLHGGGRLYRNLVPAFERDRVRVFPYFLRASQEVQAHFAAGPVQVPTLGKGKYDPTTLTTIMRLCRRHRIDVMHLFCYASSIVGRVAGAMLRVPTIIHDFDTEVYFPYPGYINAIDRVLVGATGHALAASPACREHMHRKRRIPLEKIDIVPHAIPMERFATAERLDRATARAELGWDAAEVWFVAATKLGLDRGNEYMLRAFARVAAERPAARLALVYKPTYYHRVPKEYEGVEGLRDTVRMRAALETLVAELGIADRVRFVESLDDPDLYFAACDALVFPFLHERFSSVYLLEGLAHGRPAIATDLGEQRELLSHGEDGLLVAPGDEAQLAAAMQRLAAFPDERERMGAAAGRLVRQYSVVESARRLGDLYHRLARQRVPERRLAGASAGATHEPRAHGALGGAAR